MLPYFYVGIKGMQKNMEDKMEQFNGWKGFQSGAWQENIDVRDFIQKNYTPYEGDEAFLQGPTERTTKQIGRAHV